MKEVTCGLLGLYVARQAAKSGRPRSTPQSLPSRSIDLCHERAGNTGETLPICLSAPRADLNWCVQQCAGRLQPSPEPLGWLGSLTDPCTRGIVAFAGVQLHIQDLRSAANSCHRVSRFPWNRQRLAHAGVMVCVRGGGGVGVASGFSNHGYSCGGRGMR